MPDNGEQRAPLCPICKEPVRDQKTAIAASANRGAAHFDCVLQELSAQETLGPGEKITYLGKGTFGVVSYKATPGPFAIRKRIPYEEPAPRPERPTGQASPAGQ
jgi:hypothetical protein